jgi:3,4-dihydroxy-9,10-secoandrosta-1,3,5(10)-triene-9,17-dione 4,5-dioxygenase
MIRIQRLAYTVVQSTDLQKWKAFAEQVLGMAATDTPEGELLLKMDDRDFRIAVVPGGEDRYLSSGWEVADAAAFEATAEALRKAGVEAREAPEATRRARRVERLLSFRDPAGNLQELSQGYTGGHSRFVPPFAHSGFKTGVHGLGHTVLPALPFEPTLKFYREVLGFGLSDAFDFQPAPDAPVMRIRFLHAACGRHHSLALAEMPSPAGCVHMMVEVHSMTEVGLAHDRATQSGVKFMATLGEHENDRMTSFYVMTPGGFALEYGWGGIEVDPASWKPTQTQRVSIWGHDFSVGFRP